MHDSVQARLGATFFCSRLVLNLKKICKVRTISKGVYQWKNMRSTGMSCWTRTLSVTLFSIVLLISSMISANLKKKELSTATKIMYTVKQICSKKFLKSSGSSLTKLSAMYLPIILRSTFLHREEYHIVAFIVSRQMFCCFLNLYKLYGTLYEACWWTIQLRAHLHSLPCTYCQWVKSIPYEKFLVQNVWCQHPCSEKLCIQ